MYQRGDLVWIPQGVVLHRKRMPEDDLYSTLHVTTEPAIGMYAGLSKNEKHCKVLVGNTLWEVDEKEMNFYIAKEKGGLNVYHTC